MGIKNYRRTIKYLFKNIYVFLISFILLFLAYYVWVRGISILSSYTDLSFHLATAQGFSRVGGIVAWDFWESLPLGRPHNYPPLFHIILTDLLRLTSNPTVAIRLIMEITLIGGMIVYAFGLTKLFNVKIAFWSVLLLAFSFHFVQLSLTVMPATIVIFLTPLLYHFLIKNRWVSYIIILLFMFYLHLFLPYLIILSIATYSLISDRKLFIKAILPTLIPFILYCPWLIHIFLGGWEYIKYFDKGSVTDLWNSYVLVNPFIIILAFFGLIALSKNKTKQKNEFYLFFISCIIVLSPSFIVAGRIIDGHFLPFAVIFAAFFLSNLNKKLSKIFCCLIVLFYCWTNPTLMVGEKNKIILLASPLNNLLINENFRVNDPASKFQILIDSIKQDSQNGQTITSILRSFDGYLVDKNYQLPISNMVASYTGLATLNLRQPEIYRRSPPDILKSKYLLLNDYADELSTETFFNQYWEESYALVETIKSNFTIVSSIQSGENEKIYLYKNINNNSISEILPSIKLSLFFANLLIILLFGLLLFDKKKHKKNDFN